jgi:hypothetical protein
VGLVDIEEGSLALLGMLLRSDEKKIRTWAGKMLALPNDG